MRTITLLVGLVLTTSPAFAQSRVYTNADLTSRPVTWSRTVTAAELAGLKAREFHVPTLPPAPDVRIVPHDPDWPFTTSTRDAIAVPFFTPWRMHAYVGPRYGYGGRGDTGRARDHEPPARRSAPGPAPLRPARP